MAHARACTAYLDRILLHSCVRRQHRLQQGGGLDPSRRAASRAARRAARALEQPISRELDQLGAVPPTRGLQPRGLDHPGRGLGVGALRSSRMAGGSWS